LSIISELLELNTLESVLCFFNQILQNMQNPIIIEFEQTFEHALDLGKVHTKRYRWFWIFLVVLLVLQLPFYWSSNTSFKDWIALLLPVGIMLILWLSILYFAKNRLKKNSKNQTLYGNRKITFWESHIDYETSTSNATIKWDGIVDFKASKVNYFLYLSAASAWIVPKNAFANEQERKAFEELCSLNLPSFSKIKTRF